MSIIVQFNSNEQSWFSKVAVHKTLHIVLINLAKFKWKHQHYSINSINVLITPLLTCYCIKKTTQRMFFCEFCKMFVNPIFPENLLMTASKFFIHHFLLIFTTHWTNRNQVLSIFEHVSSQLSKVINIMNFAFGKLHCFVRNKQLIAAWDHTFLWEVTWNLSV